MIIKNNIKHMVRHEVVLSLLVLIMVSLGVCISTNALFMDNSTLPKWFACIAFSVVCLFVISIEKVYLKATVRLPKESLLFAIGVILLALTTFEANDAFMTAFAKVLFFVLMYLLFKVYPISFGNLPNVFVLALGIVGIYVMYLGFKQYLIGGGYLISGPYDNNAGLSFTLVVFMVCTSYDCLFNKDKYYRFIFDCLLLVSAMILLILLESRVGCTAACISLLVFVKPRRRIILIIIGALVLGLLTTFKWNSTQGRAFIYTTSLSMLNSSKELWMGRGIDGFRNEYMLYQARTLKEKPSEICQLADNVKYPLNEGLHFLINYGLLRSLCLAILLGMLFYHGKCSHLAKGLILVIVVFSLFSYPFRYPLAWIVLAMALADIHKKYPVRIIGICWSSVSLSVCIVGISLGVYTIRKAVWHSEWKEAYDLTRLGKCSEALTYYSALSGSFFAQSDFHYNYAASLLHSGRIDKALKVIEKCSIEDYDTQLLKGNIYKEQGNHQLALKHFKLSSEMCPNRFEPLFAMYQIYEAMPDRQAMNLLGNVILNKEVKIPSDRIKEIKDYIEQTQY